MNAPAIVRAGDGPRALIGCEASGIVRRAFERRGFDVWSCDLLPAEDGSNRHIRDDVRNLLGDRWDLLAVFHPPCTRLCNSGVRWLDEPPARLTAEHYSDEEIAAYDAMDRDARLAFMWEKLDEGAALFSDIWNADIDMIAVENPVMHRHAKERIRNFEPAAQFVQPWWFGEPFFKAIGLHLKNLPKLIATDRLTPPRPGTDEHRRWSRVHRASPGPDRWRERSRFYPGAADAMAIQWGRAAVARIAAGATAIPRVQIDLPLGAPA